MRLLRRAVIYKKFSPMKWSHDHMQDVLYNQLTLINVALDVTLEELHEA